MKTAPGEFRTGWHIALGAFIGLAGSFGSLYFYSSGLFIKPLASEFGWGRGEVSLGSIAVVAGSIVAMPIAGRLVDRFGERRVAFLSAMAFSLSFAALGLLTSSLASWLVLVVLLSMVSAGCNNVSYNRAVVRHFRHHRGFALGLSLMGIGVGAALVPLLLAPFIEAAGWRAGYLALAAVAFPLGAMAVLLLRGGGHAPSAAAAAYLAPAAPSAILANRAFYTIGAMIFLASLAVFGTAMHLVPMLTDKGMDAAAAGGAASLLGAVVLASRLMTGLMLDRWDAGWVTALLLGLTAVGALLLWSGVSGLILPGCVLLGLGVGTESDLLAYLIGRRFGVRSFGSAFGAVFAIHALGAGLGGFLAGVIFDVTGNYALWLVTAAAALILGAIIALVTERGVPPVPNEPSAS